MITSEDLRQAIADCQGVTNPTAQTCIKMAAYHILLDHIQDERTYGQGVQYTSATDFGKAVSRKDVLQVLRIMDELMATLQMVKPNLYDAVMDKIQMIG